LIQNSKHLLDDSKGPSWLWSYCSWIYNYLCNQCLSPLTMWVQITLKQGLLDTALCYEICHWLATGRWFSLGTPVSSTKKTDRHIIAEILLKVALNTRTPLNNTTEFTFHRKWKLILCTV